MATIFHGLQRPIDVVGQPFRVVQMNRIVQVRDGLYEVECGRQVMP